MKKVLIGILSLSMLPALFLGVSGAADDTAAAVIQSFDAPKEDLTYLDNGLWQLLRGTATADTAHKVDGAYACKISSNPAETNGPEFTAALNNVIAAKTKRYFIMHVETPDTVAPTQQTQVDDAGVPYFGLGICPRTDGEWWLLQGGVFSNKAEVLKDGTTQWKKGVTNGKNVCLPYGFSGWVKWDSKDFAGVVNPASVLDTANLLDVWEMGMTAIKEGESAYIDTVCVANVGDTVPSMPGKVEEPAAVTEPPVPAVGMDTIDLAAAAGDNLINTSSGVAFWNVEGVAANEISASASTDHKINGSFSCKINSVKTEKPLLEKPNLVGKMANVSAMKTKRYITFHITTPANPKEKLDICSDVDDNLYYGIAICLRSTGAGDVTQYWLNDGGFFDKKVKLFKDGGSQWVDGMTKDGWVYVPFGYSGWIMLDTQNFKLAEGMSAEKLDMAKLRDVWDLTLSQVGGADEATYFDAMYALDEDDVLPNLVVTEGGNNDIYPKEEEKTTTTEDNSTTTTADDKDIANTTATDDKSNPGTGEQSGFPVTVCTLLAVCVLTVLLHKRKVVSHS